MFGKKHEFKVQSESLGAPFRACAVHYGSGSSLRLCRHYIWEGLVNDSGGGNIMAAVPKIKLTLGSTGRGASLEDGAYEYLCRLEEAKQCVCMARIHAHTHTQPRCRMAD